MTDEKIRELIAGLRTIPGPCISDALKGLSHMDPAIKPLKEEYTICGQAVTVKVPAGDNMLVLKALREGKPGDVLVVDAEGSRYRSFAGDFVISLTRAAGFSGVVADGTVRDILTIKAMDYPVFCLGATLACSRKNGMGEINGTIACGGVPVRAGDIVAGDANGVVVIPLAEAEEVLARAKAKMKKDEERAAKVLQSRESVRAYIDGLKPDGL